MQDKKSNSLKNFFILATDYGDKVIGVYVIMNESPFCQMNDVVFICFKTYEPNT